MSAEHNSDSVLKWSYAHALLMLLALFFQWYLAQPLLLVLIALLSFAYYLISERNSYKSLWLGIGRANLLSLCRLLCLSLVVFFYTSIPVVVVAVVLIACVILDGVDGSLARRHNESSDFGHYLDVEIDAFGIAVLSVLLWHYESVPVVILIAAALRYAYVWIIRLSVTEHKLEPKRRYASVIAVTVYVVMTIRLVFEHDFFGWVLLLSCLLLIASFARSLWFQWSN